MKKDKIGVKNKNTAFVREALWDQKFSGLNLVKIGFANDSLWERFTYSIFKFVFFQ